MHVQDDLYFGGFGPKGMCVFKTAGREPDGADRRWAGRAHLLVQHRPVHPVDDRSVARRRRSLPRQCRSRPEPASLPELRPDGSGATVYLLDVPRMRVAFVCL